MMRQNQFLFTTVALFSACGPVAIETQDAGGETPDAGPVLAPPTARITNKYAVSLFSLKLTAKHADGGTSVTQVFNDERIESNQSAERGFSAETGDHVTFDFVATSLGRKSGLTKEETWPLGAFSRRLGFEYSYDLATGGFVIVHRWE